MNQSKLFDPNCKRIGIPTDFISNDEGNGEWRMKKKLRNTRHKRVERTKQRPRARKRERK